MNIENMLFDPSASIATNAQATPILVRLKGESSGRARTDRDGSAKTSVDGRPTYTVDADVLIRNRDGQVSTAHNVYIHTVEPVSEAFDFFAPVFLKAEGKVFIKPFASDGRQAYSITAERLVRVNLQQAEAK